MSLEDQLREAAKKGLVSLTLHAEWSSDRTKTYWTCRATPSARHGYVGVEHALDPVEAFSECLKALPGAKERKEKKTAEPKKGRQHVAHRGSDPVTATVTEEPTTPGFDQWMKT